MTDRYRLVVESYSKEELETICKMIDYSWSMLRNSRLAVTYNEIEKFNDEQ